MPLITRDILTLEVGQTKNNSRNSFIQITNLAIELHAQFLPFKLAASLLWRLVSLKRLLWPAPADCKQNTIQYHYTVNTLKLSKPNRLIMKQMKMIHLLHNTLFGRPKYNRMNRSTEVLENKQKQRGTVSE